VQLSPAIEPVDIYRHILNDAGIKLHVAETKATSHTTSHGLSFSLQALVPLFTTSDIGCERARGNTKLTKHELHNVPFNLAWPQDVATLLKQANYSKFVVLENFHYLNNATQRRLAFDLRSFHELGVRFIVLGVWREKDRLTQYNGDLLDRIIEIPVEPWLPEDFERVAEKGALALGIRINPLVVHKALHASFGSIAVFQELMHEVCNEEAHRLALSISENRLPANSVVSSIDDQTLLVHAVKIKASNYTCRHVRALEVLANPERRQKRCRRTLNLTRYLVQAILERGIDCILDGFSRDDFQNYIRSRHPDGDNVRAADVGSLLSRLSFIQYKNKISPPVLDYNEQTKRIKVVDSTFYFFVKHADLQEIGDHLQLTHPPDSPSVRERDISPLADFVTGPIERDLQG